MDINNLYPNYNNYNVSGTIDGHYYSLTDSFTNEIRYLNSGAPPDISSYYLGWIRPENLPSWMKFGEIFKTGDSTYRATPATISENCPCGYYSVTGNSLNSAAFIWNNTITNGSAELVNNIHPEFWSAYYTSSNKPSYIAFMYYVYNQQSAVVFSGSKYSPYYDDLTGLVNWIENGNNATVDFGTYGTIGLKFDEMEYTVYKETSNGYFVRLFFTGGFVPPAYRTFTNGVSTRKYIDFFASIKYDEGQGTSSWTVGTGHPLLYSADSNYFATINISNGNITHRTYLACSGEVNIAQLADGQYTWDNSMLAVRSGNSVKVFALWSYKDIKKALALQFRIDFDNAGLSYRLGRVYCTDVNSNNEFLARWKTGNIQNIEFRNGLRSWQYVVPEVQEDGFQEDDFEEDDVPPYEPPEPPEPEPEEDPTDYDEVPDANGDNISLNDTNYLGSAYGFITQYVLTQQQVADLGSVLWGTFNSGSEPTKVNHIENFLSSWGTYSQNGTFDIASMLNFIVALRIYPIDWVQAAFPILGRSSGLRMGTGKTDLLTGDIPVLTSSTFSIDGGSVDVMPDPDYNMDYKNYVNSTVSVYIPYCGTVELNPVEVMFKTLNLTYLIDLSTGSCTAVVTLSVGSNLEYPIATKSGQMGFLIPITATNAGQVAGAIWNDGASAVGLLASGAINIARTLTATKMSNQKAINNYQDALSSKNPDPVKAQRDLDFSKSNIAASEGIDIANNLVKTGLEGFQTVNSAMHRAGIGCPIISGGSGSTALMMPSGAYIQIRRAKYKPSNKYNSTYGYPVVSKDIKIRNLKGFNVLNNVDTTGLSCTSAERSKIKTILESGFYV